MPFRILMFAPNFPQRGGPESISTGKLALALRNAGWEIDVITINKDGAPFQEEQSRLWQPLAANSFPVGYGRTGRDYRITMLGWSALAYSLGLKIARAKRYDVVVSRCQPIWAHIPALLLSLRTGVRWVANWSDPAPVRKNPPPLGRGPRAQVPWAEATVFWSICKRASWHTFPCERLKNYMLGFMPKGSVLKSSVVPHVALAGRVRECRPRAKFTVSHVGGAYFRNCRSFFIGARMFIDAYQCAEEVAIRFVGWNPKEILDELEGLGLGGVVSIEAARPYEESLVEMERSDILLVVEADFPEGIYLPSKLADYVSAGRPVLAVGPRDGTLADLLRAHGGGLGADVRSAEQVAAALGKLYESWKKGTLDRDYSADKLYKQFSEPTVLSKYVNIFRAIGLTPNVSATMRHGTLRTRGDVEAPG